jgi:hypothetical protein
MRDYSRSIVNTSWIHRGLSGTTPDTVSSALEYPMDCSRAGRCVIQNHLQVTDILPILCEYVNSNQSRCLQCFGMFLGMQRCVFWQQQHLAESTALKDFFLPQRDNHYPAIAVPLPHLHTGLNSFSCRLPRPWSGVADPFL